MNPLSRLRISPLAWMAYAIAAAALILDQWSKSVVVGSVFPRQCPGFVGHVEFAERCTVKVAPFLNFNMVWNPGMSFGLFRGDGDVSRWGLAIFAVAVAGAIGWWAYRSDKRILSAAQGLLMAGALGNMFDRFRFGAVVDFIDVTPLIPIFPWVFNVADSAISLGAALLLAEAFLPSLRSWLDSRRESAN